MATLTSEVGALPIPIGQYNVAIDVAISLTLPTSQQRKPTAVAASVNTRPLMGGKMTLVLSVENQNARVTWDGTVPTATNGILLVAPGTLELDGEEYIAALKIVGVAAGGKINYGFLVDDIS